MPLWHGAAMFDKPEDTLANASQAVERLQSLHARLADAQAPFVLELKDIVRCEAGRRLPSLEHVHRFRDEFNAACAKLSVGVLLADGSPAKLRICRREDDRAWLGYCSRGATIGGRVPANTVPHMVLKAQATERRSCTDPTP